MSLIEIFLLAIGLAMDAFAVSVASGIAMRKFHLGNALRMALAFGLFQAIMPIIGWAAGLTLQAHVSSLDHWIAFGLLTLIGAMLGSSIILPVAVIGTVTFALCLAGVRIGHVSGHFFEKKIEIAGGLVLIGIGLKILVQHLVQHI